MKNESLILMAALAIMSTSCSNDEVVEKNADVRGSAITFAPSVGHSTKATEMSLTNLGNFGVIARSIDSKGNFYDAYLIGSEGAGKVITPEIAKNDSYSDKNSEGYWKLDRNVYWPSGIEDVLFWGATTLVKPTTGTETRTDPLDGNGKFKWGNAGPIVADFSPRRSGNHTSDMTKAYTDGSEQQDLVMAFTSQLENHNKSYIPLKFGHVLSQIDIQAKEGDGQNSLNRRVLVKGAWIVNVKSKGSLECTVNVTDPKNITESHVWNFGSEETALRSAYGSIFESPIELGKTAKSILSANGTGSLMLLPQENKAWNKSAVITDTDATTVSNESVGSYILLLCRVCLVHEGSVHDGADSGSIHIDKDENKHYHQVFPVSDTYNINEYGYTCVPVPIKWEAGKKYTYTLSMCGASSGAGFYPPKLPDFAFPVNEELIKGKPEVKNQGDPVLDTPIQFTVKVTSWDENEDWHNGNDANPPM